MRGFVLLPLGVAALLLSQTTPPLAKVDVSLGDVSIN
jgi:hypothetical protein